MLAMKVMQGWDSGDWQAAAAMGTLLVAIVAAVIALVQIHQARRLREEQAAPYVIAQLESSEVAASFIDFVVKNIGRTPSFDIKLKIDPPMVRATEVPTYAFMDARVIANGVRMLAPNQEIRMHFDTAIERFGKGLPSVYTVTVYAKDSKGRKLPDGVYELDADWKLNTLHDTPHNLHSIGSEVKDMGENIASIAESLGRAFPRKTQ
jgi:hypothetical protein